MNAVSRKPPSPWQLEKIVGLARATLDGLLHEHGVILDTDTAIADALAEEQVDVALVLRRLVAAVEDAHDHAAVVAQRQADLTIRHARFSRREEALRRTIIDVMEALSVTSWPDPLFSLTTRALAGKIVISDPAKLPPDLVRTIPASTAPDVAAIRAALAAKRAVPGVTVTNGSTSLTIRTK